MFCREKPANVSATATVGRSARCGHRTQVKAGISAAHLGDHTTAEQHFAVLRALGATDNIDLYLSVANALFFLDRPEDALPYFQVRRCCPRPCTRLSAYVPLCRTWFNTLLLLLPQSWDADTHAVQ